MAEDILDQDPVKEAKIGGLLNEVLYQYAPKDPDNQQRLWDWNRQLHADYPRDQRRRNMMRTMAITDGLRHGNWPWTVLRVVK